MIIGQFAPTIGGAERQCALLTRALTARGHDVRILTVRPARGISTSENIDGVPVVRVAYPILCIGGRRIGFGTLAPPLLFWRAWRLLRRYDVIIAHQALWPAFVATLAARLRRRPIIVKLGNSGERFDLDILQRSHWYGAFARRFLLRHVTRFIATSGAVRDDLHRAGIPAERITEIPNGVMLPPSPLKREPRAVLHAVFVGTLTRKKNVAMLLEAMAHLIPAECGRITLTIVGDGPERTTLEQQVAALGITDRVAFLGMVADPTSTLASSDLFALPSHTEGLSNAALEAMAHGLPLLLSHTGGNPDLVPSTVPVAGQSFVCGATGILVDPESPDEIASALQWFISHRNDRLQMGEHARSLVEERYTIERVILTYETLLHDVTRPRVVHFLTFLDSQTGGMERQALQLARELRASSTRVFFITCAHVDNMWREHLSIVGNLDDFRVYRIPLLRGWRRFNAILYALGGMLFLLALRSRYDIVHAHQLHTSGVVACALGAIIPSKRVIAKNCAGGAIGDVANLSSLPWNKKLFMLLRRADQLIAVSNSVLKEMRDAGLTLSAYIPNGVDTRHFVPLAPSDRAKLKRHLLPSLSDRPIALFVGRLGQEKNVSVLIDAIAMVSELYLAIVGDGEQRVTLEAHVRRKGLQERVGFYGSVRDVRPWYQIADVFILPSLSEGLPNVLLEAMSCGVPVVGSDIDAIQSILQYGDYGFVFYRHDSTSLARTLSMVLMYPERASAMARRARLAVEQQFDIRAVVRRYVILYNEVIQGAASL